MKLGMRKVIIASSETTYGVCFAEGDKDYKSFPLEEDYDVDPMDSYGLSKVCNEKTARAFAMRYKADIYALRIGNVIEPHEYERFQGFPPILRHASAMPGAISTLATLARSCTFASRRTVWAFRYLTPSTNDHRSRAHQGILRKVRRILPSPANWRLRGPTIQPQDP